MIFFTVVWGRVWERFCYEAAALKDIADVFTERIGGLRNLVPGRRQEDLEGIVQGGHGSAGESIIESIGIKLPRKVYDRIVTVIPGLC
jgi:hypothetical protein